MILRRKKTQHNARDDEQAAIGGPPAGFVAFQSVGRLSASQEGEGKAFLLLACPRGFSVERDEHFVFAGARALSNIERD